MPESQNYGSHVTERYARVFTPDGINALRVCPNCEDMTRAKDGPREVRNQ
jgi:hypothetical protein